MTQVGFEPTTLEDTESLIASVSCTEVRAGGYQTWVIEFVLQWMGQKHDDFCYSKILVSSSPKCLKKSSFPTL